MQIRLALLGASLAVPAVAFAQSYQSPPAVARLVAAPSAATPDAVVAPVQANANLVNPLPPIDNGPRDLIPTDLSLKRFLTADFDGQFTQEAAVYLPIYYHAGYLSLSAEDQLEMQRIEKEVDSWVKDQRALNERGAALLARFQAIHDRGRPRGVIQEAQLLVPYKGSESKVKKDLDALRIVRQTPARSPDGANAVTGTVTPTVVTPLRTSGPVKTSANAQTP